MKSNLPKTIMVAFAIGVVAWLVPAADDNLSSTEPALLAWTSPNLKWTLFATPGTATLIRRNASGAVYVIRSHTFSAHWNAIGVSGNKLLWQRSDTGQVSLWTIDNAGNHLSHRFFNAPGSGWRAVSIALTDDGVCPAPIPAARTHVIQWERPIQISRFWIRRPSPLLWFVDDAGNVLDTDELPISIGVFSSARDFRPSRDGRWALLYQNLNGGGSVTYYDHSTGEWLRLRTDHYTATDGLVSCTLHPLPPPYSNPTNCATNFRDHGPGIGFEPTSFSIAQDTRSSLFANNLLWSRSDGAAAVQALEQLGQQKEPATWLASGLSNYRAVSLAGADESDPSLRLTCDHRPPPTPGPDDFDDL